MKRTINHTRKKRIPKGDVDITIIKQDDMISSFRADLDFDEMNLPGDARIYVEAFRRFQWNRYDFGTVDNLGARDTLDLGDLAYSESLTFRVIARDEEGKILALAEDVTPTEEEAVAPLLPVELDDIGQMLWDIEFMGPNGGPILVLNDIPEMLWTARHDEQFILSVYPEVIRKVLARIVYVEENAVEIDDLPEGWQRDWVKLAKAIHPERDPPNIIDPSHPNYRQGEVEDWLDKVREEFAAKRSKEWRNYLNMVETGGL